MNRSASADPIEELLNDVSKQEELGMGRSVSFGDLVKKTRNQIKEQKEIRGGPNARYALRPIPKQTKKMNI